jgi:uncharacterized phosphosugar-binding protein
MQLDGFAEFVAPTSTVIGAAIANALSIKVAERCIANGIEPPFLVSANTDRGDSYNQTIFKRYQDRILYKP